MTGTQSISRMSWIIRSNLIEGRQVVVKRECPIWVIRVDFGMSASCPVRGVISENAGCPVLPVEGVGLDVIQAPMAFKAERAEIRTAAEYAISRTEPPSYSPR
jgi:hypothetical protein